MLFERINLSNESSLEKVIEENLIAMNLNTAKDTEYQIDAALTMIPL